MFDTSKSQVSITLKSNHSKTFSSREPHEFLIINFEFSSRGNKRMCFCQINKRKLKAQTGAKSQEGKKNVLTNECDTFF